MVVGDKGSFVRCSEEARCARFASGGFGAARIIVTILLTDFNLRKIAAFMSDKIKADAKKPTYGGPGVALVRRRDREWRNA
ncbi:MULTISPECIES: hypothetical protein [unclassified Cryobacterium]|uniref:hypothetical protein n=1 Tax=unclassified Cryobacterium TaxID=2649013 RepID=UPI00106A3823|nr:MULTISPECIES: hypothetical protein [unclassified Cryobacterium]TFD12404.1 hypothetical protein E3T35_07480 [Cryobacterium sp. TMT1-2-2]